jgi:hypothetical protein
VGDVDGVLAMRYQGPFVHTRRAAFIIALCLTGMLLAFASSRLDLSQPIQAILLLTMTVMPLTTTAGGLRFLKKMEQTHADPTPEMTFIFGFAVTMSFAWTVFVMVAIDHYK